MLEFKELALVALLAQYLFFRLSSMAAYARNGRLGHKPSSLLTARLELRGPSFEILVLAFLGFTVASGFWGHGMDGELLIGGLLATIFLGRTIAWVWPLARIRRLGYFLSLGPIFALVALGGAGAVVRSGALTGVGNGNVASLQDLDSSSGGPSRVPPGGPGAIGRNAVTVAEESASALSSATSLRDMDSSGGHPSPVPPAGPGATGRSAVAIAEGSASVPSSDLDDRGALARICAAFPLSECDPNLGTTLRVRLEHALGAVSAYAQTLGPSDIRAPARNLLLSLADTGNAPSQYRAAKFFQQASDLERSGPLYEKASHSGYGAATYELGLRRAFNGGAGDDATVRLYELAISQGYNNPLTRKALAESLLRRGGVLDCPKIREILGSSEESDAGLNELRGSVLFSKLCGTK